MNLRSAIPIIAFLLALLPGAVCVYAGVGAATSGPAVVDTRPPVVTVERITPGTLFQGGQILEFALGSVDDHPGAGVGDHVAEGRDAGQVLDEFAFLSGPAGDTWWWTLPEIASAQVHVLVRSVDAFGNVGVAATPVFTVIPSVTDVPASPRTFRLGPARPNPFNPSVAFTLELPGAGRLDVAVYDARGRRVKRLAAAEVVGGERPVTWDGTDAEGRRQPAGAYVFVAEFRSGDREWRQTRKAILLP